MRVCQNDGNVLELCLILFCQYRHVVNLTTVFVKLGMEIGYFLTTKKHDPRRIANVDVKTLEQRQTPLHFAAAADARTCCELLLEKGADIEARDYRSRTPLFVAAELDRSVAAKFLIEMNADATAKG